MRSCRASNTIIVLSPSLTRNGINASDDAGAPSPTLAWHAFHQLAAHEAAAPFVARSLAARRVVMDVWALTNQIGYDTTTRARAARVLSCHASIVAPCVSVAPLWPALRLTPKPNAPSPGTA